MPTAADTATLRSSQEGLRALAERDLKAIVSMLDMSSPEKARDELVVLTKQLVSAYGRIGADVAADWYDVVRADAKAPGRFRAQAYTPDQSEEIERTVRRAAGVFWAGNPADVLGMLNGPIGKYTLSGSRATVLGNTWADPAASGWKRVTRAGSCAFCRMLAQRGAVYIEQTATFASHSHCNCAAAPSFDQGATEVDVRAYTASRRTSTMSPAARQEHTRRVREYIADFVE